MSKIGVVVGRFQVPALTSGHQMLLKRVAEECDVVLVIIGSTVVRGDTHDPLPAECVAENVHLFMEKLGKPFVIDRLLDHPSDETWSENLDKLICENVLANDTPTLYGGRDSFLKYYSGAFPTVHLPFSDDSSGTAERALWLKDTVSAYELLDKKPKMSLVEAFNAGVVHASSLLYPISYQCVDMIAHTADDDIVMIRKAGCKEWQLPGGFVDVADDTLETAALRELAEETDIHTDCAGYILSHRVEDYRYRNRRDKIMTSLFSVPIYRDQLKTMRALDDAAEVQAFKVKEVVQWPEGTVLRGHHKMIKMWCAIKENEENY